MWSELGHHIVWYMVMNVLEEHPGSVYTGQHDGSSRSRPIVSTDHLDCTVP